MNITLIKMSNITDMLICIQKHHFGIVTNVSDVVELDQANENPPGSFAADIEIVGDFAHFSN